VASVRRLITATLETLLTASESPATVLRRVRPGHHDAPPGPDADDDRR
jgi:hypothetical protein